MSGGRSLLAVDRLDRMLVRRLYLDGVDIPGFLDDGTAGAEPVQAEVFGPAAFDAASTADLSAKSGQADRVCDRDERETGVQTARLAQPLGHFTGHLARRQDRQQADTKVAETAAKTVLPLSHLVRLPEFASYQQQTIVYTSLGL